MIGEVETNMKRYATILGVCAAICMIGFFLSPFRIPFLSFLAGLLAGWVNLLLNYADAKIVGKVALTQNRKLSMLVGVSFITRFLFPGLIIYTAIKNPEWLQVILVLVGFSSVYAMLFIDSVRKFIFKER
ncbi:ATP synthase subunit I [Alkalicoccobacillus porphyridii]|uniref:ATP synthase subunit I n=1 Tax=Alkalicoccobacillus porphyridii TaxID=2597270 RepID=A0A553ZTE9_9BACI|nr:ATP synthase subunit I [Alkalicoccobacillus porphyridii]TSB44751.1 ATP synthase subunit I [Alkalicoccobacillus porphyridii]